MADYRVHTYYLAAISALGDVVNSLHSQLQEGYPVEIVGPAGIKLWAHVQRPADDETTLPGWERRQLVTCDLCRNTWLRGYVAYDLFLHETCSLCEGCAGILVKLMEAVR